MAAIAIADQQRRNVEVNRLRLIETLKANREKHVADYNEAMAGYKASLLEKVDKAFADAKEDLERRYSKVRNKVQNLKDEDISSQQDYFTVVPAVSLEMKVPRSYEEEYNTAIDNAEWDVNETLTLTFAQFNCFVRDKWDWKVEFAHVTNLYKSQDVVIGTAR